MIIVKLMGGLGNQMFQYAAALRVALNNNTALKLDLSFLESHHPGCTPRSYELCHLNIRAAIASPREVAALTEKRGRLEKLLIRVRRLSSPKWPYPNIYSERHFHFDSVVLDLPDNTYLEGYWQSEKYFKEIEGLIRKEFLVKRPLTGKNQELTDMIKGTDSVSIHVRRGDFVNDPQTTATHGFCQPEFYQRCVSKVTSSVSAPHFFIFSDDPAWAKENIRIPFPVTVINNNQPNKGYEDLRLMSLCRHNIIANSSFSWWGAWLNSNTEKIVCAPEKWFNQYDADTNDLIPESWCRL